MPTAEIQAAYEKLAEAAAVVDQERHLVKTLIRREYDFLVQEKERAKAAGFNGAPVHQNMVFREMKQRRPIFYAHKAPSYDDLLSGLSVSHNRQYQWLLAEAFELFEDFLIDAYGCAGATDPSVWTPQDLKAIGTHVGQGPAWWVSQARGLRRAPSAKLVLERLRLLPRVRDIELNNAHKIDFKIALLMIERMRHVIVHNRGRVASKDNFAREILSDAGLLAAGHPKPEDAAFIAQYFGSGRRNTTILLLERALPSQGSFNQFIDMWDELLG